ncbi:hypothetical protein BG004_001170 [Podila humilis]|nr:hypothetical protein BG004_001170 [Podila humilis]
MGFVLNNEFHLQSDEINTAAWFRIAPLVVFAAVFDFITDCPPNKMLVANSGTPPDHLMESGFFSDKRYAAFPRDHHKLYIDSVTRDNTRKTKSRAISDVVS